MTLEKLLSDGPPSIPARIEEMVTKSRADIQLLDQGRGGSGPASRRGIQGVHPELVQLLGTLRFRTSYGARTCSSTAPRVAALAGDDRRRDRRRRGRGPARSPSFHDIGRGGSTTRSRGFACRHRRREFLARLGRPANRGPRRPRPPLRRGGRGPSEPSCLLTARCHSRRGRPGARREFPWASYIKRLERLEAHQPTRCRGSSGTLRHPGRGRENPGHGPPRSCVGRRHRGDHGPGTSPSASRPS